MEEVICLEEREYAVSSWHIFPVRINKNRDKVFDKLIVGNIGVNLHYIPIYLHPYYKKLGYRKGLCPKAEKYFKETMTLPLFSKMSDSEVKKVTIAVKNAVDNL